MKITLKDEEQEIVLTDEQNNIPGWVTFVIEDEGKYKDIDIHIEELYPAIVAFLEKYNLNKEDRLR